MKMDSNSKSQHVKLYLKLKQQECNIQKSVALFIDNSKADSEQWHGIKRDIDKFESDRQKVLGPVHETLIDIFKDLNSIKDMVTRDEIEKIDLGNFKSQLQSLWKRIQDFKDTLTNPDALIEEQNSLEADLGAMPKKVMRYKEFTSSESSSYNNFNSKIRLRNDGRDKECDYDGVEDFCILVAKTGHTGGWSEEEHQLFLRARRKLRGFSVARLALAVHSKLPQLSPESIVNHEAWYRAYLQLRQRQRIALAEWRASKASVNSSKTCSTTTTSDPCSSENRHTDSEQRQPGATATGVERGRAVDQEAAMEAKRRELEEWKLRRQEQRRAELARAAERAKVNQSRAEARRRARAARLKRQLAQKRVEADRSKEAKVVAGAAGGGAPEVLGSNRVAVTTRPQQPDRMSALILQIYRARDRQFIERKKKVLASKMSCSKFNTQPSRNFFSKTRESTLFKETKAWQQRVKSLGIEEPKPIRPVNYIKDLPRRTIATWKSFDIFS